MIEWARYRENGTIDVSIDGGVWNVREDATNPTRQAVSDWVSFGNKIEPYLAPGIVPEAVDAERDRRIDAGFMFNGALYDSDAAARENIAGASTAALGAIIAGKQPGDLRWSNENSDFEWIAADNSYVPMDAQTTFSFGEAALRHKSAHIFAARALKDATTIPVDYADDIHWPDA